MILPTPAPSFQWQQTAAGAALICQPLASIAFHAFSTRSWKLGSRSAGNTEEASWAEVAAVMDTRRVTRLRQVHGRNVVIATPDDGGLPAGDILLSREPGLTLAVQAADCVPLLFADPVSGAIAAAHAGWRGMAAGVPQATVAALGLEFGCRPEDLVVAAGPSIGACCYEVAADVRQAFITAGWVDEDIDGWFSSAPVSSSGNPSMPLAAPRAGHWYFDGWACVRRQLITAGVQADRVYPAGLCTASHPECFPSYRRDGTPAGRIVGAIKAKQGG
jgi:YfiH family protein